MEAPKPNLQSLREERKKTITMLSEAYAEDLFDVDEFESRVDKAHQAESCEALVVLRQDIQLTEHGDTPQESALARQSKSDQHALIAAQPKSGWALAIIGGSKRGGRWRVPKKLRAISIMGGVKLDFREAILPPGVTTVSVMAVMGGVEILVPPDLAVECNGIGIMGGFDGEEHIPEIPDPSQPVLRIKGLAVMGGVDIRTRLVGESARQARKRRKREKKELVRQRTPRLPEARVVSSKHKK